MKLATYIICLAIAIGPGWACMSADRMIAAESRIAELEFDLAQERAKPEVDPERIEALEQDLVEAQGDLRQATEDFRLETAPIAGVATLAGGPAGGLAAEWLLGGLIPLGIQAFAKGRKLLA